MKIPKLLVVKAAGLLALFFLSSCAGGGSASISDQAKVKGDRKMISHAEGVEPMWIQSCPERTDHTLPFCGESLRRPDRKAACTDAYADALGKLRRAIGQKVGAKLVTQAGGGHVFEIQGAAEPITIRGAWEDQNWYEEYRGPAGLTYDCYVMLAYPRLEYENLLGMARKAASEKVAKASSLHQEGRKLAASGRHAEATAQLHRAQALLTSLKEPVVSPDGSVNSPLLLEQVNADLVTAGAEAKKTEKTALLVLRLRLDGKTTGGASLSRSMRSKIKGWLADSGIRTRPGGLDASLVAAVLSGDRVSAAKAAADKGAGLLVVVDIESNFLDEEGGIQYAEALGSFRLLRTSDGRELAAVDLGPEKQGHPRKRKDAVRLCVEKLRDKMLGKAVRDSLQKI